MGASYACHSAGDVGADAATPLEDNCKAVAAEVGAIRVMKDDLIANEVDSDFPFKVQGGIASSKQPDFALLHDLSGDVPAMPRGISELDRALVEAAVDCSEPLKLFIWAQGPDGVVKLRCSSYPNEKIGNCMNKWCKKFEIPLEEVMFEAGGVLIYAEELVSTVLQMPETYIMGNLVVRAWPVKSKQADAARAQRRKIRDRTFLPAGAIVASGAADGGRGANSKPPGGVKDMAEKDQTGLAPSATSSTGTPDESDNDTSSPAHSPKERRSSKGSQLSPKTSDKTAKPKANLLQVNGVTRVSSALQTILENTGSLKAFYELRSVLGTGSFGSVSKARVRATGAVRAIKAVSKSRSSESTTYREVDIHKSLDHPNLIKLYELFEDSKCLYMIMECCTGGNLFDFVDDQGSLERRESAHCMLQLVRGVQYLHKNLVLHRDIKAENCLISNNTSNMMDAAIKLADYGLAIRIKPGQTFTNRVGTPATMAPEVVARNYGSACDMWSVGVVCYFIVLGYMPFEGSSEEIMNQVQSGTWSWGSKPKSWLLSSKDTQGFINQLMVSNPEVRLTAKQALGHAWLRGATQASKANTNELGPRVIEDLREFRKLNKLKRAALSVAVSMLNAEQLRQGVKDFISLDEDGDGLLSLAELVERLHRMGKVSDASRYQEIFVDGDGADRGMKDYGYTEFLAATFDRAKCLTTDVLWAAFCSFDKDGNGTISMAELAQGHLLGHLRLEDIAQTLSDLDANNDSFVDFSEFKKMLGGEEQEAKSRTMSDTAAM
eukprot:TRINITY_DN12736_c0_g1_i1.p1 TRINITY_DN12736_c0_g1~~TRINITY_DN12736_c0_g1_i1.p1  ORF type:complete len:776 (+),score=184.56 TRINITY_DN12736_c0_g1_i1:83-2410(+)